MNKLALFLMVSISGCALSEETLRQKTLEKFGGGNIISASKITTSAEDSLSGRFILCTGDHRLLSVQTVLPRFGDLKTYVSDTGLDCGLKPVLRGREIKEENLP